METLSTMRIRTFVLFLIEAITVARPFLVHYSYNRHEKLQQPNLGTTHARRGRERSATRHALFD